LVGELASFHVERPPASPHERLTRPLRRLGPLAAALSAESRLLASLPSDARPPDTLGMAGVIKLMALANDPARTERAAVA
jgi:hypothetical protein